MIYNFSQDKDGLSNLGIYLISRIWEEICHKLSAFFFVLVPGSKEKSAAFIGLVSIMLLWSSRWFKLDATGVGVTVPLSPMLISLALFEEKLLLTEDAAAWRCAPPVWRPREFFRFFFWVVRWVFLSSKSFSIPNRSAWYCWSVISAVYF